MTKLDSHAARQVHPDGLDSVDFYVRNGHALHARAMRESLQVLLGMVRGLGRRRRGSGAGA